MIQDTVIRAESVSKLYKAGKADEVRAVEDISLEITQNRYVVFYGPSGSGKTTLLGLLGTLDRPTSGKIFIHGKDISRFSDLELSRIRRKTIGFVFQNFNLLTGLSAWENVAYPLIPLGISYRDRLGRAGHLLERLDLGDRLHHSPEELSGGEQQRVAIARALINDPSVLIADEPTSNIDADSVGKLLGILLELKEEGKTIILSSHDPVFRDHGEVLYSLDRGRLKGMRTTDPREERRQ